MQAMSACGLGNPKTLAEVAKGVCPANLPALALHLLSCLPLVNYRTCSCLGAQPVLNFPLFRSP